MKTFLFQKKVFTSLQNQFVNENATNLFKHQRYVQYKIKAYLSFFYLFLISLSFFEIEKNADSIYEHEQKTQFSILDQKMLLNSIFNNLKFEHFKFKRKESTYTANNGKLNITKENKDFVFEFRLKTCENSDLDEVSQVTKFFSLSCNFDNHSICILTMQKNLDIQLLNGNIFVVHFDAFNLLDVSNNSYFVFNGLMYFFNLMIDLEYSDFRASLPTYFQGLNIYRKNNLQFIWDPEKKEAILHESADKVRIYVHIFYLESRLSVTISYDDCKINYSIISLNSRHYYLEVDELIQAFVEIQNFDILETKIFEKVKSNSLSKN